MSTLGLGFLQFTPDALLGSTVLLAVVDVAQVEGLAIEALGALAALAAVVVLVRMARPAPSGSSAE